LEIFSMPEALKLPAGILPVVLQKELGPLGGQEGRLPFNQP
jgi:hypothetical protein